MCSVRLLEPQGVAPAEHILTLPHTWYMVQWVCMDGSYFCKGTTLSASGRGDEKRLEEVELQLINKYDGLLCV